MPFTCCNGTALESHTKLQDSIYFRSTDDKTLYVNLFVPSTLDWAERKVVVRQQTDFPYADTTRLVIEGTGAFDIRVRVPRWATRGFFVTINGRAEAVKAEPGNYLTLRRTWRTNDTIELRIPFPFYLAPVTDQPNVASVFYGPGTCWPPRSRRPGATGARSRSTPATSRSPSRATPPRSASPSTASPSSRTSKPTGATRCICT